MVVLPLGAKHLLDGLGLGAQEGAAAGHGCDAFTHCCPYAGRLRSSFQETEELPPGADDSAAGKAEGATEKKGKKLPLKAEKPTLKKIPEENIGCAPGFICMSKIQSFGLGHNGSYEPQQSPQLPARFSARDVWEWGCPARGDLSNLGECKLPPKGETADGMCWSHTAMLVGAKTPCGLNGDKCLCVKPVVSDGALGYMNKNAEILPQYTVDGSKAAGGVEVNMGNFEVEPMPKCDDCLALSKSWEMCEPCSNCVYKTLNLEGKRKTLGCFDKDFQPSGETKGEEEEAEKTVAGEEYKTREWVYLQGQKPVEQDLWVVPHYPLWDPLPDESEELLKDSGRMFPFQMRSEPLSNQDWAKAYKTAAPRIQLFMDELKTILESSGAEAANTECSPVIQDQILKAQAARSMCKKMQALQQTLAPAELGHFPKQMEGESRILQCKKKGDTCLALNCFTNDEEYTAAVEKLKARSLECREQETGQVPQADAAVQPSPEGAAAGSLGDQAEAARQAQQSMPAVAAAFCSANLRGGAASPPPRRHPSSTAGTQRSRWLSGFL